MEAEPPGLVFNVQRYAVHDGPGIRTLVFLKGCPLDCLWCHNPEGKSIEPELMYSDKKCLRCLNCMKACPSGAINSVDKELTLDSGKCSLCGACAEACPAQALVMVGKRVSVEDVIREIGKDLPFYEESGGGVTFSGGEPLMQPGFLTQLLRRSRDLGIRTAIETCGYATEESLLEAVRHTDTLLYDVKVIDREKHIRYTGLPNDIILNNLVKLSKNGVQAAVRFPLVPGINDSEEDIKELGEFLSSKTQFRDLNILPYHAGGVEKLKRLVKRREEGFVTDPPSSEELNRVTFMLKEYGLRVQIGG